MTEDHIFAGYIESRFHNDFYSSISDYVEENKYKMPLNIKRVESIGEITLSQFKIKKISVVEKINQEIKFNVIINTELVIIGEDYESDDYDLCNHIVNIRCYGDLGKNTDDFRIYKIESYDNYNI